MSEDKIRPSVTNLLEKIRKNKKLQYLVIAVMLILITFMFVFGNNSVQSSNNQNEYMQNYVNDLENRLSKTLSKVKDAGEVSVVITVESGMENVLAMNTVTKDTSSGIQIETTPLVINGKTVVIKELYPKITGVLIVAEGAKSITVMNKLQQATMSLLDINIDQIEILSM